MFRYKIAADAVRRRSQQGQSDNDDVMSGSPTVSPIHSPTARLRISSPGRGSPGSPRTRQQHRLRANNSRNSSTRSGMYVLQDGLFTLAGGKLTFHYLCRTSNIGKCLFFECLNVILFMITIKKVMLKKISNPHTIPL